MEKHCIILLRKEDAYIAKEALMKHRKDDWLIVLAIVAVVGILLFTLGRGQEARNDYVEGTVTENTGSSIMLRLDRAYDEVIGKVGDTIEIRQDQVNDRFDLADYPVGEGIRLLYVGVDPTGKTLEHIHSIYRLSELN